MTRYTTTARGAAGAAALLAAAGLALAGCKSSSAASGGASSPGTGGSTAAAGSGGTSSGSGGSSSGSGGSSSGSGSGGIPYFPAAAGDTWVYETSLAAGTHGTITNRMTEVVPVAGGQRVTMATVNHAIGTAGTRGKFTYIFHSDGSVTVPFTQFGSESVKVTSGSIMWPSESDLASGQTRHSTLVFAVTTAGHVIHVRAHVSVKGGGTQSVTVPAGSYQAQVVDETISEKFDGVLIGLSVETWLATGVGPVKSQLLSNGPSSVPTTVEELKSFTKG